MGKIRTILIFMVLLFTVNVQAQQNQFRDRMEAIRQAYATTEAMDVVMDIQAFEARGFGKPFYNEQALVKRSGSNYYYRLSGLEMLMNEKYLIMVNESQRIITCTRRDKKTEAELMGDPLSANLDSLFKFYGVPSLISEKDGVEHYILKSAKQKGIVEIGLHLEVTTGTISQLEYVYDEGQYVRIEFKKFDHQPVFTKQDFSEQKYFTEQKGILKVSDLYSRFRITTQ